MKPKFIQLNDDTQVNIKHIRKKSLCFLIQPSKYTYTVETTYGHTFNTYGFDSEQELIDWYERITSD